MAREGDKWRVVRGDCLWNIAEAVYGNGRRWTEIADANGISRKSGLIYPGQLFVLPGITSSSPSPAPVQTYQTKITFEWFALDAGTDRSMFAVWAFDRSGVSGYEVRWEYDTGAGGWRIGSSGTVSEKQTSYSAPVDAKKVKLSVKPVSESWSDGVFESREYNFSNNPPLIPPVPQFEIDQNNKLTVTIENIDEDINADSIEIAIYQDNITKYKTGTATINMEARYVNYTTDVETGHKYKVRCRAVRGNIYSGWSDFTDNDMSTPNAPTEIITLRPQIISEQMSKQYGIFIEWTPEETAKIYEIQWTTNIESFDVPGGDVSSQTTSEEDGARTLILNLELGHEYFFRVRSINDKGNSQGFTPIKSTTLGTKPSAPTTYSNVSNCIVGEDLKLYWVHNSTDGSIEKYARLNITVIDSLHPELEPMVYTKVIENTKPEEDQDKTSVYVINTTDPEWTLVQAGFIIKWKVQTCGIVNEYSDWSIEREVNVYAQPELEIDIINQNGDSLPEVNTFPFYISVLAKPAAQVPISYYIEVVSNGSYETVDSVGNIKNINIGDKVYQRYFDPQTNPWKFVIEMTPGNIDLENDINYTVNVTVSMNSGLSATNSQSFDVYFHDMFYTVGADITINRETLEANIHPYCLEYHEENEELIPSLTENATLIVYRREYDGTFKEIATDIPNQENMFVTDPHPSLDYARYRIVSRSNDTGAISYADVNAVKVGEPSVVIQWAEKWSRFEVDDDGTGNIEPSWSGSLIKIPYNIDISDNKGIDVSLVSYAGRQHPVSYYGTQLSESSTWNVEIPIDDKELLYGIRRLSRWDGDVYVREPSGLGYWANINVSYNIKHNTVTIPITFNITRVEGGI